MELVYEVAKSICEIDEAQWDACAGDRPVVRHAFFRALENAGCFGLNRGVLARYVLLRESGGRLVACAPAMLKWGNKREYGPEIQWLKAGLADGCFAWPKLQVGSPFYPMMGPKLLIHPDGPAPALRAALIKLLLQLGRRNKSVGAFNLSHIDEETAQECVNLGALVSHETRSGWHNPGCATFLDYVSQLPHRKRRTMLRERQAVALMKLDHRVLKGDQMTPELIHDYYEGFTRVCNRYGGKPWIPEEMFVQLCRQMPEAVTVIAAFQNEKFVAGVFCLQDSDTLYADTWSAMDILPALCFDYVCYRPIEYAFTHGLQTVDAGPVGLHKRYRGYTSEPVYHAHWFYNHELKSLASQVLLHEHEKANHLV